jgi:hypothetical protein
MTDDIITWFNRYIESRIKEWFEAHSGLLECEDVREFDGREMEVVLE